MEDIDEYRSLTTRQAASLVSVHESSIKRWCKNEQLPCNATAGGHRRIQIEDLIQFAKTKQLECSIASFAGAAAEVWSLFRRAQGRGEFEPLTQRAYAWLQGPHPHQFKQLINFCLEQGFDFSQVFDNIIAVVLRYIGEDWHQNRLGVGTEHYLTEMVRDLMSGLRVAQEDRLRDEASNNGGQPPPYKTAIAGCNEGNLHDLGARAIRMVLEQQGWRVVFLGADVPASEFAKMQVRHNAQLLCISFVTASAMPRMTQTIEVLSKFYDASHPYHLAIGGHVSPGDTVSNLPDTPLSGIEMFQSVSAFSEWLKLHHSSVAA